MIDRIFSTALTFTLLLGGTLAIGSELLGSTRGAAHAPVRIVQLERVTITAKRLAPAAMLASADSVTAAALLPR